MQRNWKKKKKKDAIAVENTNVLEGNTWSVWGLYHAECMFDFQLLVAMNALQIRGYRIARNMVSILTLELYVVSSTLRLLDYAESFCLAER